MSLRCDLVHIQTRFTAGGVTPEFAQIHFFCLFSPRRKVLKGLIRSNTPTELAKTIGVARSAVSRIIQALEKVGLVECMTPDEKMDRYYRTTEAGKTVVEIIEGKEK